ncbi:MAG: hypothetical protein OXU79_04065 [Gemmatimonadota bacterium]|nr:hypothetical protein [Gemmatimonadota bacterium]
MDRENRHAVFRILLMCLCFLPDCLLIPAYGVEPVVWRDHSQKAFARGEADGVSITRDGAVLLAPELQAAADTGEEFVWALAEGRAGRLYIATGNGGKIFTFDGSGAPTLLFDSPEVAIFSLAVGTDGTLYAGSSPDGIVYRIVQDKEPETFCRTGDEHVWAMVVDGKGGLYAATGGRHGRILRISAAGEVHEVYKSEDHNVVSLIRDPGGRVYAGTDQSGLVYRVNAKGGVEVLYDAAEDEIHALAMGPDGILFAGAMSKRSKGGGKGASQQSAKGQGSASSQQASVLYAIRPSGAAVRLWSVDEPMLLALHADDREITVLTGDGGSVYRVDLSGRATLLTRLKDVQPWVFCRSDSGDFWLGTAGAGKVYRLGRAYAREGRLESRVRDFRLVSRWGKIRWNAQPAADASVQFQTRSGNSEKPDNTWSEWSSVSQGGQISSPPARFLQYRAELRSLAGATTPTIREVSLVGLQENLGPRVLALAVSPIEAQGNGAAPKDPGKGRKPPGNLRSVWRISWKAEDANNDGLVYALYYRGLSEKRWKLLEENLRSNSYDWHTESAPEGTMLVRVVASDRLTNPQETALAGEMVSQPFDLDHTPPSVVLQIRQIAGGVRIEGSLNDAASPLWKAAYAVNSGAWNVVFPVDRIFDSRTESLRFEIQDLAAGEYTVVVRATDALGNVGVGTATVDLK